MKVELLYFDGCPSYEEVRSELQAFLAGLGTSAELELIRVESAEQAESERFLGSPTVRIDGLDIDPSAEGRDDFGLECRLYRSDEGVSRTPPLSMIREALDRARAR